MPIESGIDPRAFVTEGQVPDSQMVNKSFVSAPETQVSDVDAVKALIAPKGGDVSEETLNATQQRYNQMLQMAAGNHGYGSLAAGIASIFMGQKAAKLQKEVNKTQVQKQNLELESAFLQNARAKSQLKMDENKLAEVAGMDALARLEANASDDINTDVKLAGGEFTENGAIKTNWQKAMELQKEGKIPGDLDLEEIAKFSPGLIVRMGQKASKYTNEAVIKELNDAGRKVLEDRESQRRLQGASVRSGRGAEADEKKNFDAFNKVSYGVSKTMTELMNSYMPQEAKDEIIKTSVIPRIQTMNSFGLSKGIITKDEMINPETIIEAFQPKGDDPAEAARKLNEASNQSSGFMKKVKAWFGKPETAPDEMKTQKAPPVLGAQGNIPSKKEIPKKEISKKPETDPRLKGLGIPVE